MQNVLGNTALHYAVLAKNPKCIDALIQNEVDETIKNNENKSPWEMGLYQIRKY